MKLQELLRKCDFDKMFEYIVKFDSKSEGSRFAYLVAYELLCDMEAEEGREYDVDMLLFSYISTNTIRWLST